MGFQLPEPIATVVIEDGGPYHGVEAEIRQTAAWSVYREIIRFKNEFLDAEGVSLEDDALQPLYALFADHLVSWNIEDHKGAVPATVEGLNRLPVSLALQIIGMWADVGVGYVPDPLAAGSTGSSPEPSTPTPASLSPSPKNGRKRASRAGSGSTA